MVDLAGYVIILVETKDKKIKLYGSPADRTDLEIGDEILEVNGRKVESCSHTEVISHIHECIKSRVICLRVKRRTSARVAADLAHSVQDAFVIAVEQQARERLEKLSHLKRIKPVDMNKLSSQVFYGRFTCDENSVHLERPTLPSTSVSQQDWNGIIERNSVYVTSLGPTGAGPGSDTPSTSGLQQQADSSGGASAHPPRLTNGHGAGAGAASSGTSFEEGDATDFELKQDYVQDAGASADSESPLPKRIVVAPQIHRAPQQAINSNRRASSPFTNGRTELLIPGASPQEDARECRDADRPHGRLRARSLQVEPADGEGQLRPRSSILGPVNVEVSVKGAEADIDLDLGLTMLAGEHREQHREMAVDVPDSFIARSKTPPRYPPPRPKFPLAARGGSRRLAAVLAGGRHSVSLRPVQSEQPMPPPVPARGASNGSGPVPVPGPALKPVPPPRDHLRIEKDGRLVNRAPAPQLPARSGPAPDNNNGPEREPTKEQLHSIRKFQEQIRKRKEEEDRQAQLNRSLRSVHESRKLQELQEHEPSVPGVPGPGPVGVINDGYSSADEPSVPGAPLVHVGLHRIVGYGELVAAIQRLQLQLKKTGNGSISSGGSPGYTAVEGQLAAVQTLLLSPAFGNALAVHNKVQQVTGQLLVQPQRARAVTPHAQGLVRHCLDVIQPCSSPEAAELADLLTRYELEGLLLAHDAIASQEVAVALPIPSDVERTPADEAPRIRAQTPPHLPVHTTPAHVASTFGAEENIKIIKIEKTNEPLGATVRNEGDAVMIGRVVRGGAAEKTGLLHQGDEVLEVNGVEMRGKSVNEVCDILAAMTGTLTFLVVPARQSPAPPPPPARDTLMHVKAHFDYDPEDDLFIPCRELGVSFQKGDVLHVISQEDPNWWQAYREGEEDQTLAGLIPSKSFQHQREAHKQASIANSDPKEKTKKASTLLCAKKNAKKKKKKGYGSSYIDGSYPLYSSSTTDDYDSEEILTYEEVALYYPRANHKRPVVLIGPPNIGRHELRQRLMEDSERFAAAIPHTSRARKENEVDGQDYHFITRQQFEADILARKFVEHGEYERAYYGTSLDAIRSVVAAGKICVLNLHPQSLRILRNSDLKPYVVLVAPPALEKLRQKKLRNGEAFKEEELKETIEKAREMEEKYGHMLDLVIINSDTERAFSQLLSEINSLEREPQWVPTAWVKQP